MAIVFRGVKGSNLTPSEVDGNFADLNTRVTSLETDPPAGVSVAGFTVSASTFRVNLSDGSTFGPYELPYATFGWAGTWTPGDSYALFDVFFVSGYGVYMALGTYDAPTEFDPDEKDTDNNPLLQAILVSNLPMALVDVAASRDMLSSDLGAYLRVGSATTVVYTLPLYSTLPVAAGSVVTLRQSGLGQIEIDTADSSIVVTTPETLLSRKQGATITLINVGPDVWDLAGDLETL